MRHAAFFALFLLIGSVTLAQSPGFTFTTYTRANGLSDNFVQSILEDSRGFIWFGTREGLNRFDGSSFRTYYSHQQLGSPLPGNSISYLQEYKPGHLFFQSDRLPVCMNTITQQLYVPASLKNKTCLKLSTLNGYGYAMTEAGYCYLLDRDLNITDSLAPPLKNEGDAVQCEYLDDSTWLLGSTREYFLYHRNNKSFSSFLPESAMPDPQHMMAYLYFDQKKRMLYFSNFYTGLYVYDLKGKVLRNWPRGTGAGKIPDGNIAGMLKRPDGSFWLPTYNAGIIILNESTGELGLLQHDKDDPASLPENAILTLYTDHNNNTWAGTSSGVCKLNNTNAVIRVWRSDLGNQYTNNESYLLNIKKGRDQNMYLSTFGTPVVQKIDTRTETISTLDAAKFPLVWCSNNLGDQLVFSGATTAITLYDPVKKTYRRSDFLKKYFPVSEIIILAFRHSNGDEWYSANNGGGFVRIDARDGSVHSYKKDGPRGKFRISYYSSYAEDRNGDLWFGVNKSEILLHWILKEDRFEEINLYNLPGMKDLAMAGITDLKMDGKDNLWVAIDGGGVFSFNIRSGNTQHFGMGNGLPTNYIGSLQPDGRNRIWIGTTKGLCCFIPEENKITNFTRDDGLPEDFFNERCTYFDSATNSMWVGSINSLIRFNPDSLLALQRKTFPIYIDEITVNGKPFTFSTEVTATLQPSANTLQFRFTGVDINNGKEIEYSYKLNGADEDWIYNEHISMAEYANLAPGDYTFSVRARHKGEQVWTQMKAPFRFTILTPWYRTIWFKLLLTALIALISWFIIRTYYQRKLERERSVQEKKNAIEKERTRIATDMHDDFGASLSRIKFLSEKLQIGHPDETGKQKDLEKISEYSDEMAEKMGEIVWALNKRYDSTGDLLSFCRSYASEYLAGKQIHLHFSEEPVLEMQLNGEIRRNIFLVMKEALHNIVKHAGATQVWLDISFNDTLKLTIRDDGKGFDPDQVRPFSNGLTNMRKRTEDIGGTIHFSTGQGTEITIVVDPAIRQNTYPGG